MDKCGKERGLLEETGSVEWCFLVGKGTRGSEVGQKLEAQTDNKVPDVPGHLRASDKHTPDKDQQDRVECVTDVPQSKKRKNNAIYYLLVKHSYCTLSVKCECHTCAGAVWRLEYRPCPHSVRTSWCRCSNSQCTRANLTDAHQS